MYSSTAAWPFSLTMCVCGRSFTSASSGTAPALFEKKFVSQAYDEDRSIEETLDLAWDALSLLPSEELQRLTEEEISEHYKG